MRRLKRKTEPRQHILNLDHQKLSNPVIRKKICEEVTKNINCNSDSSYSEVSDAIVKATSTVLPKRGKAQPSWFRAEESCLLPLREARNNAMRNILIERHVRAQQDFSKFVKTSKLLYIKQKTNGSSLNSHH